MFLMFWLFFKVSFWQSAPRAVVARRHCRQAPIIGSEDWLKIHPTSLALDGFFQCVLYKNDLLF